MAPGERSTASPGRASAAAASPVRRVPATGLKILLVEDNRINQRLAIELLEKRGNTVSIAENGQEALDAHDREQFDLILMDLEMPVMDGLEATRMIRERESKASRFTPVIAMTAHAMKGDAQRCLATGMDGVVTKPIRPATMFQEIERAINRAAE